MTANAAAELLENVAARLDANGWTTGTTGPPQGPNCLAGVFCFTATDHEVSDSARDLAWYALTKHCGSSVTWWNDHVCASAAEAADMLRLTAKDLVQPAYLTR